MQSPRFLFPHSPPDMLHAIPARLSRSVFHPRMLERWVEVSGLTMESRMLLSLVALSLNLVSGLAVTVAVRWMVRRS